MGAGASTVGDATGVFQGVENRKLAGISTHVNNMEHYQSALIQTNLLKDCSQDFDSAAILLRTINECQNENINSIASKRFREELCGHQFDAIVMELLNKSERHVELQRECLIAIGSLCYQSEKRKTRLVRLGAGASMVRSLTRHIDIEKVQEEGLWAIGNISAAGEGNKHHLFS